MPISEENISIVAEEVVFKGVRDRIAYGEFELRAKLAKRLIWLFIAANAFVAIVIGILLYVDWVVVDRCSASGKSPAELNSIRLIDHQVIMALIGATTIQVGAIMFAVFGALFPKPGSGRRGSASDTNNESLGSKAIETE